MVVAPVLPSVVLNEVASIFLLRVSGETVSGCVAQDELQACIGLLQTAFQCKAPQDEIDLSV